jgi:RNA polymerase sigma-70 factor, ECF subfamily
MSSRPTAALDVDSRDWPRSLRANGQVGEEAVARLHALLLRAARFEVARRRPTVPRLRVDELDDIALEVAGDALVGVLGRLHEFRGDSRFSTWAYKFAVREAAAKLRKRAWQARELPGDSEAGSLFASIDLAPGAQAEQCELLALQTAIADMLTPHQRRVLVALVLNDVPIDVLAERLESTRGALYETLRDARRKLRGHLARPRLTAA